ncbi:MAG: hypothetical protein A2860_04580 [Candidatus Levybacteria bacterium RIFCSPHIGHO2_01_FULL_37_33]|nr:MAG: hypothetical protein A2860_04580 [Candidatus Levybacteria bacterium RIFCSPHIGHO2_01_FULL_37_33]OGH32670.1 MAG: hypothetical protein A2953_00845 [Candidatus Levybacteria bacterium RIFCSPLOWO2_01_FULL_36_54]
MVIGINAYEAVVPRFGYDRATGLPNRVGSSEFCFQLLTALSIIDKQNEYFIYLPINPASDMPAETKNWHYEVIKGRTLWTLIALSKKLFFDKEKPDVFFSPTHYLPFYVTYPSVVSILDVSYLHFPKLFKKRDLYQLKLWGRYSIKKAKKIITISKSSKNDIIKAYGVSENKISVIYPGVKSEIQSASWRTKLKMQNSKLLKEKYRVKGDYILFVGTLQPRKNIERLVEAFSRLKSKVKNLNLVIIGKKGWMYEDILNAPEKYNVSDRVKFLDSVSDEELPVFYQNAICFVLPSLYEGFGLPVLEAMKYGCPVITSNVSSLPEAGGDAALYFNPENVNDIAEKIKKVIEDKTLREEMIQKGYQQIKKFSWEKTARETLQVLEQLAKSS